MADKIHALNLVNASALVALSCLRDLKTFENPLDVLNAGAICSVILKRLPAIKDNRLQPQGFGLRKTGDDGKDVALTQEEAEEWMGQPFTLKLTELMRDTLKKALEKHVKEGALTATAGVTALLVEAGLAPAVTIPDDLLA